VQPGPEKVYERILVAVVAVFRDIQPGLQRSALPADKRQAGVRFFVRITTLIVSKGRARGINERLGQLKTAAQSTGSSIAPKVGVAQRTHD
jgi:hypothetical protein